MYFHSLKSSGKEKQIIPLKEIIELSANINNILINSKLIAKKNSNNYIVLNELEQIIYISNLENIIDYNSILKYLNLAVRKIVLVPRSFRLVTSELHVRWPSCNPIPPHQDNFYHCFSTPSSFKILVPLTNLMQSNGCLSFADVKHDTKILDHIPSSVPAFSSYISKDCMDLKGFTWTSYELEIGDISWHSINSIHYAQTNSTDMESCFLVFRYDHIDSIVDNERQLVYQNVYDQHKRLLNNMI